MLRQPISEISVEQENPGRSMVRKRFKLSGGTLDHSGEWLIRLVHMRRCAADCAEIDWGEF